MKNNIRKRLWMLIPAFLILSNPTIACLDVLPDALAYLCILFTLFPLQLLNEGFQVAYKKFQILLYISLGELIATFFIYGFMLKNNASANPYERPTFILAIATSMTILQIAFLIPAFKSLFDGLFGMSERFQGNMRLKDCDLAKLWSFIFVIAHCACMVLPEASILTAYEYDLENPLFPFNWYDYVGSFRFVSGSIGLAIGIAFFVFTVKCISTFIRKNTLWEKAEEYYKSEFDTNAGFLAKTKFQFGFAIFVIAFILCSYIQIDNTILFPNVYSAGIIFLGILFFWKEFSKKTLLIVSDIILAGVSILHDVFYKKYINQFTEPESSLYSPDAYNAFLRVRILEIAMAICTLIVILQVLYILYRLICKYLKVTYDGDEELSKRATKRIHKEFFIKFLLMSLLFILAWVGIAMDGLFQLQAKWIWLLSLILNLFASFYTSSVLKNAIYEIGFYSDKEERYD